ncbi:MAG: hypothetical protein JKY56_22970 [Kofleriaceae bacterium]|nr:hypothetical protein [Kofleriaceae bacterium]
MTSFVSDKLSVSDMVSIFLGALSDEPKFDREALEIALADLLVRGSEAHPGFAEVDEDFLRYAAARLPGHYSVEEEVARLKVEDLLLT